MLCSTHSFVAFLRVVWNQVKRVLDTIKNAWQRRISCLGIMERRLYVMRNGGYNLELQQSSPTGVNVIHQRGV